MVAPKSLGGDGGRENECEFGSCRLSPNSPHPAIYTLSFLVYLRASGHTKYLGSGEKKTQSDLAVAKQQIHVTYSISCYSFSPFFLFVCCSSSPFSHLAKNPFICDCNLRWLADYLHRNPIETSGARCESPKRMHRRRIDVLRDDKFKCNLEFYTHFGI